ncbi:MAG: type II CRISPR RNA-guided endonuclease Cas9, partial [Nitrospinales bacterium]
MSYILGLDLGTNSIGWACIDEKNQKVHGKGSRIFPEGVDRDTKGKEVSKNTQRRNARQLRRRLARRVQRKENLYEVLISLEMAPQTPSEKGLFFQNDPYKLRKKGLDDKLTKLEFGRVLYHLNQRRGFKSSRKAEKEKEDGIVAQKTTELQKEIEQNNCRTLGEFFSRLNSGEQRIRDRYTLRKMYEEEFDLLWKAQKIYHPELTDELKNQIRNQIIFYQRPLKSQAKLIGFCSLETNKRRSAKERLVAQKFRILETINRLSMVGDDGVEHNFFRKPDEEFDPQMVQWREKLIQELWEKEKRTFKQITKLLCVPETNQFNLEKGGMKYLKGNTTGHAFASVFGKTWHEKNGDEQEKIHQVVRGADDPEWLKTYAREHWGLAEDKAQKLAHKTNFQSGYLNYSTKALNRLIPHLEKGLCLTDAKDAAGYSEDQEIENPEDVIKNLRNPIVQQTLYELMRILKTIRKNFGDPEMVRVELARDLKASAKKREEIHFENLKRKAEHEEIRTQLLEEGIKPTRDTIIQYKLWEECGKVCPYTGDSISKSALFGSSPTFQVEHIIPYSRSLDDSYMNKTLCRVDENKRKGNQTPYEFYNGKLQFDEILRRLKKNISDHRMPYNKLREFLKKEVGDDFISRQLNDTAYICRQSKKLMEAMGFKVTISKGQATSELRHLWGLNTLISGTPAKNRGDHRHHAIDAA